VIEGRFLPAVLARGRRSPTFASGCINLRKTRVRKR
jgi:Domain of unknown function (DUF4386)